MTILKFVVSPDGVVRLHDAITCLSKFDEQIGWEATKEKVLWHQYNFDLRSFAKVTLKLVLSALNPSKTASAQIAFSATEFFQAYEPTTPDGSKFQCFILAKALLAVFKGRILDSRERDSAIERCEVQVQDGEERTDCRVIAKMLCRHGVIKTYKLTYEPGEVRRAVWNPHEAKNKWTINSHVLRSFSEYFGVGTEHLDFYYDTGRFVATSYREKITNGLETLKQPLQTSVNLDRLDFDELSVEERLHVGISVKDFRAIIAHADGLRSTITAQYSVEGRPFQFRYQDQGISCDYTLMTIGEYRGGSVTPAAPSITNQRSNRPSAMPESQRPQAISGSISNQAASTSMPPPIQPASRSFTRDLGSQVPPRPSPPPPQASVNHDSLFVQDDDEDERRWGDRTYEDDQDELRWDPGETAQRKSVGQGLAPRPHFPDEGGPDETAHEVDDDAGVPPTQRMSQVAGIFDEP